MVKIIFIFFLFSLLFPSYGSTQVYKWVDEKGNVYFSDDITKIPERYKKKIERVDAWEEKHEVKLEGDPASRKKPDDYRDLLGRGEEYWKNRVEEWRSRLKEAQEKNEQARIKYNELTERYNDSKSSVERNQIRRQREQIKLEMDQYKNQMEEAKIMLDKKIPEEVERYKAKQEWIK